jgi:hypothetical protein
MVAAAAVLHTQDNNMSDGAVWETPNASSKNTAAAILWSAVRGYRGEIMAEECVP